VHCYYSECLYITIFKSRSNMFRYWLGPSPGIHLKAKLTQSEVTTFAHVTKYKYTRDGPLRCGSAFSGPTTALYSSHLHAALTRRTNGRSLGSLRSQCYVLNREALDKKVLLFPFGLRVPKKRLSAGLKTNFRCTDL
jgi:hypothetical protein